MTDVQNMLDRLHADLGWKRLRSSWAKAEIFLGLFVAGLGIFLIVRPMGGFGGPIDFARFGVVLFVLGGYLAMAGHRSHLYQSNNALAAWLAATLGPLSPEPDRSEQIKELP